MPFSDWLPDDAIRLDTLARERGTTHLYYFDIAAKCLPAQFRNTASLLDSRRAAVTIACDVAFWPDFRRRFLQ